MSPSTRDCPPPSMGEGGWEKARRVLHRDDASPILTMGVPFRESDGCKNGDVDDKQYKSEKGSSYNYFTLIGLSSSE